MTTISRQGSICGTMLGCCVTGNFGLAPGIPVGENLGCLEHDYPLERILAAVHLNVQVGQSSGAGAYSDPLELSMVATSSTV